MNIRFDKDDNVYIDWPNANDKFVIYKLLDGRYCAEVYNKGWRSTHDSQVEACKYAIALVKNN